MSYPPYSGPTPPSPYQYPPPPPALPPRKKRSGWFWLLIIGGSLTAVVLIFSGFVWMVVRASNTDDDDSFHALSGGQIAVVDVSGVILSAEPIDDQLRKFGDDSQVKAIILHINSPGGGAAASQEIYHEVLRIRTEKKKKVIASIESVGASGAYYIASGCDKIYANDASVVGSIGVIMEWTNYGDLMRWAKLKNVTVTSGALKDAGDPTRDMTPAEQVYFQSLVNNMYGQFINDVASGRKIDPAKIKPLATGEVWTGQQAMKLGLIDKEGGFRVALIDTAQDAGIRGEPNIVRPSKPKRNIFDVLGTDADSLLPNPTKLLDQSPGFYYMWR